ncbi:MAG: sulfate/molybdate ABC transporter ATP-binding protein [Anaerocolumna sp.]
MSLSIDISKKFKGFTLNVKLNTANERMGLLGASGCGKSMTLKCIAGIETPDQGRIVLNDKVLFDSERKINLTPRERKVGYLFQNYALFPNMTVEENIGCGLQGRNTKKRERISDMIEFFHLKGLEKRYPSQLSGGQQQRVALARIFAYEPKVLMLDEPFSALDTYLKENLQQELLEVLDKYHGDILLVSHNRDEIYTMCNHVSILEKGTIILSGNTKDIFREPRKVAAARLTGCKNISGIEKLSDYTIKALDWDLILHTKEVVSDRMKHVGIRARDIRVSTDLQGINSFPCTVQRIHESPFEINMICKSGTRDLWWKISNAYWKNTLSEQVPKYMSLPMESLMLLE